MPDTPPTPTPAPAFCAGCGYDLAGLAAHATCPECAHPVDKSLRGPLLRFADPVWLARVQRGVSWMSRGVRTIASGAFGVLLLMTFMLTATLIVQLTGGAPNSSSIANIGWGTGFVVLSAMFVIGFAMLAIGSVWAGTIVGDHGGSVRQRLWPAVTLRWTGPVFAVSLAALPWLSVMAKSWPPIVLDVFKGVCQAIALVFMWSLAARLEDLESRTEAWNLERAKKHRSHRKGLVVAGVLCVVFGWVWTAPPTGRVSADWGGVFAVVLLAFFVRTLKVAAGALQLELERARGQAPPG